MDSMSGFRHVGKTVRRFSRLGCVALKLDNGVTLEAGTKLKFERDPTAIGGHGFHESVQTVVSIEVDHERRLQVTADDGICAVKLNPVQGADLPPTGCAVMAFVSPLRQEASPYMVPRSGL